MNPLLIIAFAAGLALGAGAPTSGPVVPADSALFAGGSFWGLEAAFEALPGVDSVVAGYAGEGPAPDTAHLGKSAYLEAVKVYYRPGRIAYAKLLDAFWRNIDPTRADGQFTDSGRQYRTAIFWGKPQEKKEAEASRSRLERSHRFAKPVVTEIRPMAAFTRAGDAQQDFYKRERNRFRAYYLFSGREAFFAKVWGKRVPGGPVGRPPGRP